MTKIKLILLQGQQFPFWRTPPLNPPQREGSWTVLPSFGGVRGGQPGHIGNYCSKVIPPPQQQLPFTTRPASPPSRRCARWCCRGWWPTPIVVQRRPLYKQQCSLPSRALLVCVQRCIPSPEKTAFLQISLPDPLGGVGTPVQHSFHPLPFGPQFLYNDTGQRTSQAEGDEQSSPRRLYRTTRTMGKGGR